MFTSIVSETRDDCFVKTLYLSVGLGLIVIFVQCCIFQRAVTAAKNSETNWGPIPFFRYVSRLYGMAQLSMTTVVAFVVATVVTGMAFVSSVYRYVKTITRWLSDFVFSNGRRMSICQKYKRSNAWKQVKLLLLTGFRTMRCSRPLGCTYRWLYEASNTCVAVYPRVAFRLADY